MNVNGAEKPFEKHERNIVTCVTSSSESKMQENFHWHCILELFVIVMLN